jgi:AraC family transcriptional regulator
MRQEPLQGPHGLFNVSSAPRFVADSNRVGWAGAFFTELRAAQTGTADHGHTRLCIQHSRTGFELRELRRDAGWNWMRPGLTTWCAGDEQRADWRGGGAECHFLFVEASKVEEILGPRCAARRPSRPNEVLHSPVAELILQAMVRDLHDGSPAGPLVGDGLIVALLAHVWGVDRNEGASTAGFAPAVRRRVLSHVEEHLAQSLSLAELANVAGMSVRHFCRAFRASLGCSPHQYLLRQRVECAKALIAARDMPLAQVAQSVGFSDQSQFTRTFRRHAGLTPAAHRALR